MARLWDADSGDCLQILEGHTDEIFSCAFNYEGDTIITGITVCTSWRTCSGPRYNKRSEGTDLSLVENVSSVV